MTSSDDRAAAMPTADSAPWTNVYGLARTLLAIGTLSSLLMQDSTHLFRPLGMAMTDVIPSPVVHTLNLFALLSGERLELARWLAIVILIVVASGWRPRITGVLHWWIAFSYCSAGAMIDGGDQIAANLTLFLIPITLTDPRRWHWAAAPPVVGLARKLGALVARSAHTVIRIQVAVIYLHAAVGKLAVTEWVNGTALYYWFQHPLFGAPAYLRPILTPLVTNGVTVMAMTWGVICLELALFCGLVVERRYRPALFVAGMMFHFSIILVHGLVSFFFATAAALILYLRPLEEEYHVLAAVRGRAYNLAARLRVEVRRRTLRVDEGVAIGA